MCCIDSKTLKNVITCLLCVTFFIFRISAAPVIKKQCNLRQPDGSFVLVMVTGDECYQEIESVDGYSLIRDPENGWICFATLSENHQLISTGFVFKSGSNDLTLNVPAGLPKHLKNSLENIAAIKEKCLQDIEARARNATRALRKVSSGFQSKHSDTLYGITILVDFPDQKSPFPEDSIIEFLNKTGYSGFGCNGSVKDYFFDISGGKFVYFQKVISFVTAQHELSWYDRVGKVAFEGTFDLVNEILSVIKNDPAFRTVGKAVTILYAGTATAGYMQGLWPHKDFIYYHVNDSQIVGDYIISGIGTSLELGTICHETCHLLFGWPDLYAYDQHSLGAWKYDLMSYIADPKNPPPPNPYFRFLNGWEDTTELSDKMQGTIFKLKSNANNSFFYSGTTTGSPKELFCIEARTKTGRYAGLPDEGLLIWHIDKTGDNTRSGNFDYIVPEQADGKFDLENNVVEGIGDFFHPGVVRDLFHADYKTSFNDTTVPSAVWHNGKNSGLFIDHIGPVGDTMTFTYSTDPVSISKKNMPKGIQAVSFYQKNNRLFIIDRRNSSEAQFPLKLSFYSIDGKQVARIILHSEQTKECTRLNFKKTFMNCNQTLLCNITAPGFSQILLVPLSLRN